MRGYECQKSIGEVDGLLYFFFDEGNLSEEDACTGRYRLGSPDKNEVVAQGIICCR